MERTEAKSAGKGAYGVEGIALFLLLSFCALPSVAQEGAPLAEVVSAAPGISVEMRYAGGRNFTGKALYSCGRCFLTPRSAGKLAAAQALLEGQGLSLKVWDCYRPLSVQRALWSLVPDSRYVADPKTGSRHNRGTAVDVTLVDLAGVELEMGTGFDDFSPRAAHGAAGVAPAAARNREVLAGAMRQAGFRPLATEWWHYDDADGGGGVLDLPFEELCKERWDGTR